nr:MAG TPA: hypothetical protein [Caudoviricetes sp.]
MDPVTGLSLSGLGITESIGIALLALVTTLTTTVIVQRTLWRTKALESAAARAVAEREAETAKAQLAQSELQLTLEAGNRLREDLWRKIEKLETQQAEMEHTIDAMRSERILDVQVRLTLRTLLETYPNPPGRPTIPSAVERVLAISEDTDNLIRDRDSRR